MTDETRTPDRHGGEMPHIDPATRWKDREAGIDGDDMRCICGARWPCLSFLLVFSGGWQRLEPRPDTEATHE